MDRNYFRMMDEDELFRAAVDNPSAELAVVLAEFMEASEAKWSTRLEEAKDRAKDFEIDANQLDDKVYELRMEIAKNEETIAAMAAEIKRLKETAK